MARCLSVLLIAAFASLAFVAPSTPRVAPRVALHAQFQESEKPNEIPLVALSVLAGLVVSLLPQPSWAGTGSARPDFQVVRPGYMQGIDAANAASKPGEVDFVTRSRIEAAQFPKALKEVEQVQERLRNQPSKEERVANSLKQLEQYEETAVVGKRASS